MTRVPAQRQPLRTAIALVIISLLTTLMAAAMLVTAYVLTATGALEEVATALESQSSEDLALRIGVVLVLALGVAAIAIGLNIASVVLGILVVVRGDGKLRIGAGLLLAVALLGLLFSITVDGPMTSGTIDDVMTVIEWTAELVRWGVTIAGIVILTLGIREVRRARAERPVDPR